MESLFGDTLLLYDTGTLLASYESGTPNVKTPPKIQLRQRTSGFF
jgi:hypothetical protein